MVGAQVGSQYEQRAAVAAQRVRELDERRRELAASVTEADDAGRPERLRRRQSAAEAASRHAAEADWMARVACGRAADAHERAAAAHERAADRGVGDVAAHRVAAAHDRQAAAADRLAASSRDPH